MKQRSCWLTHPRYNAKKFVYSVSLLLLISLSVTIVSFTSDFAIFDDGPNGYHGFVPTLSLSFSEIHSYLPVVLLEAFAIVDTWTSQDSDTNRRLRAVSFTDSDTGHVVGRDGTYRSTSNTGSSWQILSDIGTSDHIYGIHTVGLAGYTVGATGAIRETVDGGQSWTGIDRVNHQNLYDLHYDSRALGLTSSDNLETLFFVAVGTDGTLVSFTRENNVVTRELQSVDVDILADLYGVHFDKTHSRIWAVGTGGTIVSTNGGITGTWSNQTSGTTEDLYKVHFVDANHGWAVGNVGTIIHTVDGGTTWNSQDSSTDNNLFGLSFYNSDHGWAVGTGGTVVYTADGGTTWSPQTSGTTKHLYDVIMLGPNRGWAVGDDGTVIRGSNTKLMLEDSIPDLDLYNGTLSFKFDRTVDVSDTILSKILITDRDGKNGVKMTGATMSTSDSKTLTVFLNESQRQSITLLQHGPKSPLQINVSAAAISDTIGNNFAGISNAELTVNTTRNNTSNDDKPPLLVDLTPDLDLNSSVLRFEFDETIDVSKTNLSKITITDSKGRNSVTMTGAVLPTADSATLTISLNESQRQSISAIQRGFYTPLQIDVASFAIKDTTGNGFAGITNGELSIYNDLKVNDWKKQDSGINTRLLGVHFTDLNNGWVVGNDGLLFSTINGGTTWVDTNIGVSNHIRNVHFADSNSGWVVGDAGAIHATTNGGTTWSSQSSGTTNALFDVQFIDSQNGWAVGNGGTVIHTTDGGTTWSADSSGTTSDLRGIHFSCPGRPGWAIGQDGTIIITPSNGGSWSAQSSGVTVTLNDIYFIDANRWRAVGGDGAILSTINRGADWNTQTSGVITNLNGVHFSNVNYGWVVGGNGIVVSTINGGATWDTLSTPVDNTLRGVYFTDFGHGWAVGDAGTVLQGIFSDARPPLLTDTTPDLDLGAATLLLEFDEVVDASATMLSGITVTDSNGANGVSLAGAILPAVNSDTLTISMTTSQRLSIIFLQNGENIPVQIDVSATAISDIAGNKFAGIAHAQLSLLDVLPVDAWEQQDIQTSTSLLGVHFIDMNRGWAVGNNGILTTTTDGGATWSVGSVGAAVVMRDVHFVDSNHGWAVGNGGSIRATNNGGTTWTALSSGTTESLFDIYFVDADNGWVVGDNGTVIRTTDGGTTWNTTSSGTTSDLRGIHFSGPGRPGWAIGQDGTIIKALSNGGSWTAQTSTTTATLNNVHFIDANRGWVVGDNGTILATTNRGTDWNALDSDTTVPLNNVHFTNSDQGWVAGAGGTVLVTNNGGVTWCSQSTLVNESLFGIDFVSSDDGWAVGNNGTILHGISLDVTPPLLTDDTPDLDLIAGTLLLKFDEVIDTSATLLSGEESCFHVLPSLAPVNFT